MCSDCKKILAHVEVVGVDELLWEHLMKYQVTAVCPGIDLHTHTMFRSSSPGTDNRNTGESNKALHCHGNGCRAKNSMAFSGSHGPWGKRERHHKGGEVDLRARMEG